MVDGDGRSTKGAPESWHETDEETLAKVDTWIEQGHPDDCLDRMEALYDAEGLRYETTHDRLLAHVIDHHDAGLDVLKRALDGRHPHSEKGAWIRDAIHARSEDFVNDLFDEWGSLASSSRDLRGVAVAAGALSEKAFERLWSQVWSEGVAEEQPACAGQVFRVAAFDEDRAHLARDLLDEELRRICGLFVGDVVYALQHAPMLEDLSDSLLPEVLEIGGAQAARAVVSTTTGAEDASESVVAATRILLAEAEMDDLVPEAVGLSLHVDPDFAIPIIVRWTNEERDIRRMDQSLRHYVQEYDPKPVIEALATDTLERPEYAHSLLARSHWQLLREPGPFIEWLEDQEQQEASKVYRASLVIHVLSNLGNESEWTDRAIEVAEELHDAFGRKTTKELKQRHNLHDTNQPRHSIHLAIAQAKDVEQPPVEFDGDAFLRTVKRYPSTYRALGGKQLERYIEQGKIPLHHSVYEPDFEEQIEELYAKIERGDIHPSNASLLLGRILRSMAFRARWEERFEKLYENDVHPSDGRLRDDPSYWTELVFHAKLLEHFDVVEEPADLSGLEEKRPEFLLCSEDGDLIFEATAIQASPQDIQEGARFSDGLSPQNKLESKWRGQFRECHEDIDLPVVIAVQTQWGHEVEADLTNSLYGPLAFSTTRIQETGEVVSEGASRDTDQAFFLRENADCISAVVGTAPEDPTKAHLEGEVFRPPRSVREPLSPELYIRLRTALFGAQPAALVSHMEKIPSVSRREAEVLVDHGVDDASLFAAGSIEASKDIPLRTERLEAIREEAQRMVSLNSSGQISHLPAAGELDLAPLHEAGLFTLDQLLDADERPEGIGDQEWQALRQEAKEFRGW